MWWKSSRAELLVLLLSQDFDDLFNIHQPRKNEVMTIGRPFACTLLGFGMLTGSVESFSPVSSIASTYGQHPSSLNAIDAVTVTSSTELVSILDEAKGPIQSYVNIW